MMRQGLMVLVVIGGVASAGCASMGGGQPVSQRVDHLEGRVQALESVAASQWQAPAVTPMSAPSRSGSASRVSPTKHRIQRALQAAGYYAGPVDGKIGPKSRSAIKTFQRDHGLKVDGVVGSQTWTKLAAYLPAE